MEDIPYSCARILIEGSLTVELPFVINSTSVEVCRKVSMISFLRVYVGVGVFM